MEQMKTSDIMSHLLVMAWSTYFDCAYFYRSGDPETSIGKLVKIYETPTQGKRVKVVWFFRPGEVRNFLGEANPHWNELFLASGEGKGVYNINSWVNQISY